MRHLKRNRPHQDPGSALIVALLVLALFSAISAAVALESSLQLRSSKNAGNSLAARLTAESGMNFMLRVIQDVRMDPSTTEETVIAHLWPELSDTLDGTPNLGEQLISVDGDVITVPLINWQVD